MKENYDHQWNDTTGLENQLVLSKLQRTPWCGALLMKYFELTLAECVLSLQGLPLDQLPKQDINNNSIICTFSRTP